MDASVAYVQGSVALRVRKLLPVLPVPSLYLFDELAERGPALYPDPFGAMGEMRSRPPVERILMVLLGFAGIAQMIAESWSAWAPGGRSYP